MTVNPQAQTLLDAAAMAEAAGAPAPQELELSNCGLYSKLREARLPLRRPTSGMSRISPYPVPPEAFLCAITGLRG